MGEKGVSVGARGRVVGRPQVLTWQLVLLAVVHATRSKGLSGPDIATSGSLSTLTTAEESEQGKGNITETHDTDGDDKSDDEALVLVVVVVVGVEITVHVAVADGVGGGVSLGGARAGARVGGGGSGDVRRAVYYVRLKLLGGLSSLFNPTACDTFIESVSDVIGDLQDQMIR